MDLKHLERLHNQVAKRLALLLGVVDAVAQVLVLRLEKVEDGQNLPRESGGGGRRGTGAGDRISHKGHMGVRESGAG